jgi:hypothetical protein
MTSQLPLSSPLAVPCDQGVLLLIEPPEGWVMAAPTPPAKLTLLDASAPGPTWPNINLTVQDLGKLTPDEFVLLSRLQMKSLGDSVVVEKDEPIGRDSGVHRFDFLAYPVGQPVRCRQHIMFHGRRAYVLTAMAPSAQFEAYRERFARTLDSVVLRISA